MTTANPSGNLATSAPFTPATPQGSSDGPARTIAFLETSPRRKAANAAATTIITGALLLAMVPLVWLLYDLISHGAGAIANSSWWTFSQKGVLLSKPGGGAAHAMIGTLVQAGITTVISVPVGILVAVYLVEYAGNNRLGRITTFMVDILSGVPSIVAALFIYSVWIVLFGFERSGIAVSLALVLLMLPVIIRTTEEMLRIVPQDLREASYALGTPKWLTIVKIVLPTAGSGIITGIMLAIARVMGESAPVLILVGSTQAINWDPFKNPQSSLPLMMLDMYKAGTADAVVAKMWGAAITLVLLIAVLNIGARIIAARYSTGQR